ncbi:ATP-binding cassette domain-containing protein [Paenibacillus dendritiformis]|uniref:Gx transporter family protein n=1 Tax=Paenibacillus dendritiformis TaxID=130049 RepID=UPI00143DCBC1|nr:Gx transporter family protein [Paenibacillus dendritiformis]NKI20992.1 ATP-binding cassette domain-containing protein [Paenibacillus dendritiformis]NRF98856.1 Gx transporter family protein [Paenibacillus dendritiformis]
MRSYNSLAWRKGEASSEALKRAVIIAIFSAVAVVLGFVEAMLPVQTIMPIPGAKLGLANVMILACLYFLRGRDALMLVILKTLLMTLMLGTFSAFLFSFLGSLFSFAVMYAILKIGKDHVSLIGISVVGGAAHNAGQLTAAYIVFRTANIFYYLPVLLITGVVTGVFIGIAVKYIVAALAKLPLFDKLTPQIDSSASDANRQAALERNHALASDIPASGATGAAAEPAPVGLERGSDAQGADDAVVLSGVRYQYRPERLLFDELSLRIPQGQWVSIVGPNGSGKSTLVKLLNGLHRPQAGRIAVAGLTLTEASLEEIRRRVGFLFQNPDNQFFATTVRDDIAFGMENRCLPLAEMERRLADAARRFGVEPLLDRHPAQLSGGQKQRAAIAGMMVLEPEVLIFDEATSMLDERSKREMTAYWTELHASGKYTIISITHDAEEIMASERAIVLKDGKIAADVAPEALFADEALMRVCRLQAPFVWSVAQALRERGVAVASTNDERELVNALWPSCTPND